MVVTHTVTHMDSQSAVVSSATGTSLALTAGRWPRFMNSFRKAKIHVSGLGSSLLSVAVFALGLSDVNVLTQMYRDARRY